MHNDAEETEVCVCGRDRGEEGGRGKWRKIQGIRDGGKIRVRPI